MRSSDASTSKMQPFEPQGVRGNKHCEQAFRQVFLEGDVAEGFVVDCLNADSLELLAGVCNWYTSSWDADNLRDR